MTDDYRDLLGATTQHALAYIDTLANRPVYPDANAIDALANLAGPLPQDGQAASEVIADLNAYGSPATVASAGGRYFGFVTGGALPAALAANWLAGTWDQNAFSDTSSPVGASLDNIAATWVLDVLHLPASAAVAFVTGATMANFTCLAAARGAQLARLGWDVEAQGLFGAPPLDVIVSAESHAVVYKALGLLGLGRARVRVIPTDSQGRMRANATGSLTQASIVCLQAGNVNTGASDPISAICDQANEVNAWVHVDGAFGLWANAAPERAHLNEGVEKANSWATDGHKWLNVPYDCGIAMVSDERALRQAVSVSAAYLPDEAGRQPIDYTPEASRRARGVEVWAALRHLGRAGVADLIERTCAYASDIANALRGCGYEILNDVCLNQVLVRFGDDETTAKVLARIQNDGTCWCGGTVWQGQSAVRISVSSWATTARDIEQSTTRMIDIANDVTRKNAR
ncbi:MAG: glutamate/tyrosine decarboxylase-like PLP-dependent enzyme [Gammaproteobacteria bacterium]|jgi:glutamate/tyrosine decarboxylase-like PLP-dependent enzyme